MARRVSVVFAAFSLLSLAACSFVTATDDLVGTAPRAHTTANTDPDLDPDAASDDGGAPDTHDAGGFDAIGDARLSAHADSASDAGPKASPCTQGDAIACVDFDESPYSAGFDYSKTVDGGTVGPSDVFVSPPAALRAHVSAFTAPANPYAFLARAIPSTSFRLSFDVRVDPSGDVDVVDIGGLVATPPYYASYLRYRSASSTWQMFEYGDAQGSQSQIVAFADTTGAESPGKWTHVDLDYDITGTASTVTVSMDGVVVLPAHALGAHLYAGARHIQLGVSRTEGAGAATDVFIDNVVVAAR